MTDFDVPHAKAPSTAWSVLGAVVLLVVGSAGAFLAGSLGSDFQYELETNKPALGATAPMVPNPGTPPLAQRVVIVIVDGLRLDTSFQMPYLAELRRLGVDGTATSHYPTYSRPNYVAILTGAPPVASGVRTNFHSAPVILDSLMDRARAAGLRSGFASDASPIPRLFLEPRAGGDEPSEEELKAMEEEAGTPEVAAKVIEAELRGDFQDAYYAPWPGGFRDAAEALARKRDQLLVLHIGVVDVAGHAYGGASPQYRTAAEAADRALRRALASLDWERDAVIVVADHGHTDRGGHGGTEPEVTQVPLIAAGAGIRPGSELVSAELIDVAPTAAALLGIAAPGHGLGRVLTEILEVTPAMAQHFAELSASRVSRNRAVVEAALGHARTERLSRRATRIAVIVAVAAVAVAFTLFLVRAGGMRFDWRVMLVSVPAFFIVYYTLIGVIGQRFSPSLTPERGEIANELIKYGAAGTVVHILAGWWAMRRRHVLAERLAAANGVAVVGLTIAMLSAALVWAYYPAPYVAVPGPRMMVLIPAVLVAVACYAVGVATSQLLEVIVFFARAVDPRARLAHLERAAARARAQMELEPKARAKLRAPPRKKERMES